jgi:hypothetical protein
VPPLKVDSYFGPKTLSAVIQFQRSMSLMPDGTVGIETWRKVVVGSGAKPASATVATTSTAAVTANAEPVSTWSLTRRFTEVLKLAPGHMKPELAAQFRALLTPLNIGITVGALTTWAVSHAFGVGEVVDLVLAVAGTLLLGMASFTAGEDIGTCLTTTVSAQNEADLDKAADSLAQAIAIIGVVSFFILLAKVGAKFGRGAAAEEGGEAPGKPPRKSPEPTPRKSLSSTADADVSNEPEEIVEEPTPKESELAASPGDSPAQIAARQKVARSFYENADMSPEDMESHLNCINMKEPVRIASIPPDGGGPQGNQLWQWSAPNSTGQYFSNDPSITPSQLGVDSSVVSDGQVVPRMQTSFTATQPISGLQSTAAPAVDTWSVPGQSTATNGGGPQFFVPRDGQTGLVGN